MAFREEAMFEVKAVLRLFVAGESGRSTLLTHIRLLKELAVHPRQKSSSCPLFRPHVLARSIHKRAGR